MAVSPKRMRCPVCERELTGIGKGVGVCPECIRERWDESRPSIEAIHSRSRESCLLPITPPKSPDGLKCKLCFHSCCLRQAENGYCSVRQGSEISLRQDGRTRARASYYYDPLPTNCVADWVCAGGTGAGYPEYAHANGPEVGFDNLAVFFEACNFNCLYCQNWRGFKQAHTRKDKWLSVADLVGAAHERTSCICYFGGDPTPQLPYALRVSETILAEHPERIFRICWETNGSMHPAWLRSMVELAIKSGGCIKVDLKAWHPQIHKALCGHDNRQTLDNFARLASWADQRPDPPLLVASTLLVPGYVDEDEVRHLAQFIAHLNPNTPYSLLGFAPHFMMDDFPTTSRAQAKRCLEAALGAGLQRVRIGNQHLLS